MDAANAVCLLSTHPTHLALPAGPAPAVLLGNSTTVSSLSPADAGIAATGCLAGFASGLLGIGGGTVVTPLLALLTGMPQQAVLGEC